MNIPFQKSLLSTLGLFIFAQMLFGASLVFGDTGVVPLDTGATAVAGVSNTKKGGLGFSAPGTALRIEKGKAVVNQGLTGLADIMSKIATTHKLFVSGTGLVRATQYCLEDESFCAPVPGKPALGAKSGIFTNGLFLFESCPSSGWVATGAAYAYTDRAGSVPKSVRLVLCKKV